MCRLHINKVKGSLGSGRRSESGYRPQLIRKEEIMAKKKKKKKDKTKKKKNKKKKRK